LTEREHTGKKIVDCQIIGPAAAAGLPDMLRRPCPLKCPAKKHDENKTAKEI